MSSTWTICRCGHFEHAHELQGFFLSKHGACEDSDCECKRYDHMGRMSIHQADEYRRTQCSPSQPPTSGTSLSPSLSSFLSLPMSSPNPAESEKPSPPQPEPRAVPVVGFRAWNVGGDFKIGVGQRQRLVALNSGYGAWEPGVNVARCHAYDYARSYYTPGAVHPNHPAPVAECACGFYVLTDFDRVPFNPARTSQDRSGNVFEVNPPIVGAVVGWGRVIQHGDEGWRAEKVQIIGLLDCKLDDAHLQMTREVAAIYGVPVVGRTALELIAKEYGDRLA